MLGLAVQESIAIPSPTRNRKANPSKIVDIMGYNYNYTYIIFIY
jgi:hypothetical protein